MKYRLTLKSKNKKTGPIPVSTTSAASCPPSCPFSRGGCYAKGGPLALVWRQVDDIGTSLSEFCGNIAKLPAGQLWRHNQAGDLPGQGETIDAQALAQIVKANQGKRGFTYTHKSPFNKRNAAAIAKANRDGFTINLSGNNLAHADKLADLNIAPVVTVLPSDGTSTTTPAGRKVVQCPATYRDGITCASCQLCQRQRSVIVGFPAHGAAHRKASAVATLEIAA
jgi:hypothetical protein